MSARTWAKLYLAMTVELPAPERVAWLLMFLRASARRTLARLAVLPQAAQLFAEHGVPNAIARYLVGAAGAGQLKKLPDIATLGLDELRATGVTGLVVTTAQPVTRAEQPALERALKPLGETVVTDYRADQAVLGGVRLSLGSRVIDRTVRTRLADLTHTLIR